MAEQPSADDDVDVLAQEAAPAAASPAAPPSDDLLNVGVPAAVPGAEAAPRNPFDPAHSHLPFAGREAALARLFQHLTDTQLTAPPPLFLGRRRIGKTALLRQFDAVFEEHFIGVYLPLRRVGFETFEEEAAWLRLLAEALLYTLHQRGFSVQSLERLMQDDDEYADSRDWLRRIFLPQVFHVIRANRRIVLLLDDAERLVQAMDAGKLPADHPRYLATLLHAQLGLTLTMDTTYEAHLSTLAPLVSLASVQRLPRLSPEACAVLLADCRLGEGALKIVQAAAGGEPVLIQRFGYHLYALAQAKPGSLSAHDVNTVLPLVYADSEAEFAETWLALVRDERLVLTAMCSLLYEDRDRAIDIALIERWLVDTDYPLDVTAIRAAVRGLEYRELVMGGVRDLGIVCGLMQRWLINNTRLASSGEANASVTRYPRRWLLVLGGLLMVILLVALIFSISRSETSGTSLTPVPTVTLRSGS